MRYIVAFIVLVGGAMVTSVVDRALDVRVKSPNIRRRLVHNVLLMAQGSAIFALVLHW